MLKFNSSSFFNLVRIAVGSALASYSGLCILRDMGENREHVKELLGHYTACIC